MAEQPIVPDSLATMGTEADLQAIRDAMSRISNHSPADLNAVAQAVSTVLGFTLFSRRYSIAVLALEALQAPHAEEKK